jgi:hypothetical protein
VFNACMISAAAIPISIRIPWVFSDVFVVVALLCSASAVGFDLWLTVRRIQNDTDPFTFLERTLQVCSSAIPVLREFLLTT